MFARACRPKNFIDILGQDALIATLTGRLTHEGGKLGKHLVLDGPSNSGKMTIARMYAQAILCESRQEDGSPCQRCDECVAVTYRNRRRFSYIELDAQIFGDEEHVREQVEPRYRLNNRDWLVFVIDNAEALEEAAGEAMLERLESVQDTIFIFAVNDMSKFPAAIRSRCELFQIKPVEREVLVNRLMELCIEINRLKEERSQRMIVYEEEALRGIAKLAGGYVGAAFQKLATVASKGDVTFTNALKILKLDWGESMHRCWEAQLRGRREEALSCFEEIAPDDEGRIRAMQSFVLAMHLRFLGKVLPEGSLSPALDCLDEGDWRLMDLGWDALSQRCSIPVDDLLASVVKFWMAVTSGTPSRPSFLKGYEVVNAGNI